MREEGRLPMRRTVGSMARRDKKREAPVSYRPPAAKREEFASRVASSGLPVNAFITAAIFGKAAPRSRRKSALGAEDAAKLMAQAGRVSDRLNRLQDMPVQLHGALLEACRDELVEIRTCLLHLLGRDP
jgi:hypothetical protein